MVRGRSARFLTIALLLAACEGSTEPGFPDLEMELFSPPPKYETWWGDTEELGGAGVTVWSNPRENGKAPDARKPAWLRASC